MMPQRNTCPQLRLNASLCDIGRLPSAHPAPNLHSATTTSQFFPSSANLVAFASYPHSGNSWLRALLGATTGAEVSPCDSLHKRPERPIMVKTHRSPFNQLSSTECEVWFGGDSPRFFGERFLAPDRVVHLVRNPIDVVYSVGALTSHQAENWRSDEGFQTKDFQVNAVMNNMIYWEKLALKKLTLLHNQSATDDDKKYLLFRVRYEDALEKTELVVRAIIAFLWHAHRPEERHLPALANIVTDDQVRAVMDPLSCEATGEGKCRTGTVNNIGRMAECFNPQTTLAHYEQYTATLADFGYELKPQASCDYCAGAAPECNCLCPLESTIKHDKEYSGLIGPDGSIVMTLEEIVEETDRLRSQ